MFPLLACTPPVDDRPRHEPSVDTAPTDTAPTDTAGTDTAPDIDPDAELWIVQLDLDSLSIGESALVVGPDGTSVLVDVGNDSHAQTVEAAVAAYLGHPPDYVVLTHHHADHIGGVDDLGFAPREALLWRGPVDMVSDSNEAEVEEVVATGWPEERLGEFDGEPRVIDLGGGAVMRLFAVAGAAYDGRECPVGDDENARSVLGAVQWGDFDYVFGGDLTGGGKDTPDCEDAYEGLGWLPEADLLHLSHHGIESSTSQGWLDRVLPPGANRNAVVGANVAYGTAPDQAVVDRVTPHLGAGKVWVTRRGLLGGEGPSLVDAESDVLVRVVGGARYSVHAGGQSGDYPALP